MNTTDNPQHNNTAGPDPARLVPEPQERPEPGEATSTPEAVRAAQVARDDKRHALVRGRGVEWVRPTDLIARHSAHAAGRGLDELTVVTGHGCDGIGMQDALVGASAHLPARRCRHHDHTNPHQHRAADGLRG